MREQAYLLLTFQVDFHRLQDGNGKVILSAYTIAAIFMKGLKVEINGFMNLCFIDQ